MKKFLIQIILLLLVIGVALYLYVSGSNLSNLPFTPASPIFKQLQINGANLKVEIADTQSKRSKGLGGRQSIASDEGMLFIFPKADKYPFWMKGLNFPLDFVWIKDNQVVELLSNVQPPAPGQADSALPIYKSSQEVDQALEVTAGTIDRLNIKVGNTIKLL